MGGKVEQRVDYETAIPKRVHVITPEGKVRNTGKSLVRITVVLEDEEGHPTSVMDREIPVMLSATRGELQPPNPLKILKGMPGADATLTCPTSGLVTVSAFLENLRSDPGKVEFVFPWLLVVLAATGGVVGAIIRDSKTEGFRLNRLGVNLIPGVVLGFVFYGLTLFGAIGSIPQVTLVNTALIPTLNELGAFLLGLMGGLVGARFLQTAAGPQMSPGSSKLV